MLNRHALLALSLLAAALLAGGCSDSSAPSPKAGTQASSSATPVTLALNWVPEPELGGFYAAELGDSFKRHGLAVAIEPGGAGAPVVQRVATGQVPFGIVSADEVVIARAHSQGVVAVFAVYQTCPQGLMVHAARNITSLQQLFETPGTIAMEPGLPYVEFLKRKYGFDKAKVVPYSGGVAQFLQDKDFSQQCFITSEPLDAKKQGGDPQTFLISDSGYNPYTSVVATSDAFLKDHPQIVQDFVIAAREGWESYLKDPAPANAAMGKLNTAMDAQTFADAAKAQAPLIRTAGLPDQPVAPLGMMNENRWSDLAKQLVDLGIVDKDKAPRAGACFMNFVGP